MLTSEVSPQASNFALDGHHGGRKQEDFAHNFQEGASTKLVDIANQLMEASNTSNLDLSPKLSVEDFRGINMPRVNELINQTNGLFNDYEYSNLVDKSKGDSRLAGELSNDKLLDANAQENLPLTQVQKSIVFVDSNVKDHQSLVAGISPEAKVVVLNSSEDGIEQITKELSNHQGISTLEFVSEGAPGRIQLGQTTLDSAALEQYSQQLQSWADALTDDADILIDGCDVAQGEQGTRFVTQLSQLTGADVAASTDLTGNAEQGGNWELEYQVGQIDSVSLLQPEAQQNYKFTLANSIPFPEGFMKSILDYGAKPDDGIDDTAAIQKALDDGRRDANGNSIHDDYYGRPKALYFSAGTYDVSNTLNWIGSSVTLQGAGSGATVIRLKDNAAGFENSAAPKAVIQTPAGNRSFRQFISNLAVDTGKGNAGAIGIDYIANNVGAMRDVKIQSGDGKGFAGLAMDRFAPGPCLIKNVEIDGFDYGIRVSPVEYGPTFENITLKNQQVAGINNIEGTLTIRGLNSYNSVPVIKGTNWDNMVTLVDANLQGGAANVSAIETEGEVYARNINTSGYQSAIKYKGAVVPGTNITEYASNNSQLFDGIKQSLNLPIKETPEFHDNNTANWGRFEPKWYGETGSLQSLLNSGKSTVYFNSDAYFSYNETVVTVPDSVKRIVGFSSVVNGDGNGTNGGGIKFVVEGNSSDPLIVEGFGYGVKVEQKSSRPVALKDGWYQYTSVPGAGDLFLEDVGLGPLYVQPKQNVWARQFNNEYGGTKIVNDGGNLWTLGLKTEQKGTVIESKNNANTELLGGFILPVADFSGEAKNQAAFTSDNSNTSLVYRMRAYNPNYGYNIQVKETRDGETRQMFTKNSDHEMISLFSGKKA